MARLATLLPDFPHALWQLPPVTRVAMSWLCEMATAQRALPPGEPSYRWVDFEAMLADPAAAIAAQATHFGLPVDSARIDATLAGPRPDERRVGNECVSTCRSRGAPVT